MTPELAAILVEACALQGRQRRAFIRRKITKHGSLLSALSDFMGVATSVAGVESIRKALSQ